MGNCEIKHIIMFSNLEIGIWYISKIQVTILLQSKLFFILTLSLGVGIFSVAEVFAEAEFTAEIKNVKIIEEEGNTILTVESVIKNIGDESSRMKVLLQDSQSRLFDSKYDVKCEIISDKINPTISREITTCFEIPNEPELDFTFIVSNNISFGVCDWCITNSYPLNIQSNLSPTPDPVSKQIAESNDSIEDKIQELEKKIKELESANKKLQNIIDELQSKLTESGDSAPKIKKEIASFVDKTKDPQSYVDRYNNEASYKEWFDENYPDYTIHEAVGKRQPIPDWIKNNAIWWSEGKLSEDEFVGGIEYLVKNGIIKVD